jgi:hypothetical protein
MPPFPHRLASDNNLDLLPVEKSQESREKNGQKKPNGQMPKPKWTNGQMDKCQKPNGQKKSVRLDGLTYFMLGGENIE